MSSVENNDAGGSAQPPPPRPPSALPNAQPRQSESEGVGSGEDRRGENGPCPLPTEVADVEVSIAGGEDSPAEASTGSSPDSTESMGDTRLSQGGGGIGGGGSSGPLEEQDGDEEDEEDDEEEEEEEEEDDDEEDCRLEDSELSESLDDGRWVGGFWSRMLCGVFAFC